MGGIPDPATSSLNMHFQKIGMKFASEETVAFPAFAQVPQVQATAARTQPTENEDLAAQESCNVRVVATLYEPPKLFGLCAWIVCSRCWKFESVDAKAFGVVKLRELKFKGVYCKYMNIYSIFYLEISDRGDFMGNKGKNETKDKNNSGGNIQKCKNDYDKLITAIVEANRIARKEEEAEKFEASKNDSLTASLVGMLRLICGIVIGILGLGGLIIAILSCASFYEVKGQFAWAIVLWVLFYFGVIVVMVLLFKELGKKPRKKTPTKTHKFFGICAPGAIGISLLIAVWFDFVWKKPDLLAAMNLSMLSVIVIGFLLFVMYAVKREKDRNFLVSYFSAMVSVVALIVSLISLVT